jgi:hypothetical protein
MFNTKTKSKMNHKAKYGYKIADIMNNYFPYKYDVVTMNHPLIVWASRKGFVRIISATQQEWTQKGIQYFFNK